jgi:AraC family transcriptional regulator
MACREPFAAALKKHCFIQHSKFFHTYCQRRFHEQRTWSKQPVNRILFMKETFMQLEPRIETVAEKKLIGRKITMSLANNRTGALWQSFMPRRREVQNTVGTALFSIQVYEPLYFDAFSPDNEFEKWAAVEVTDFTTVPNGMETYILPQGLYAVFPYKGASTDATIFQYIFSSWLPNADYVLDSRPHFEVLGDRYQNADPDSEEDICIPVKPKH